MVLHWSKICSPRKEYKIFPLFRLSICNQQNCLPRICTVSYSLNLGIWLNSRILNLCRKQPEGEQDNTFSGHYFDYFLVNLLFKEDLLYFQIYRNLSRRVQRTLQTLYSETSLEVWLTVLILCFSVKNSTQHSRISSAAGWGILIEPASLRKTSPVPLHLILFAFWTQSYEIVLFLSGHIYIYTYPCICISISTYIPPSHIKISNSSLTSQETL